MNGLLINYYHHDHRCRVTIIAVTTTHSVTTNSLFALIVALVRLSSLIITKHKAAVIAECRLSCSIDLTFPVSKKYMVIFIFCAIDIFAVCCAQLYVSPHIPFVTKCKFMCILLYFKET
eukprot:Selendium_serpulae@DN4845_c0_g1_i3.p2